MNFTTIKGGSRRADKSRKVLMMMKAAKLACQTRVGKIKKGAELEQEQGRSRYMAGAGSEQVGS